jgi:hypothetical protein
MLTLFPSYSAPHEEGEAADVLQHSRTVYVGDLPPGTTMWDLRSHYERYGDVLKCRVVTDASSLYGFVRFATDRGWRHAIAAGRSGTSRVLGSPEPTRERRYVRLSRFAPGTAEADVMAWITAAFPPGSGLVAVSDLNAEGGDPALEIEGEVRRARGGGRRGRRGSGSGRRGSCSGRRGSGSGRRGSGTGSRRGSLRRGSGSGASDSDAEPGETADSNDGDDADRKAAAASAAVGSSVVSSAAAGSAVSASILGPGDSAAASSLDPSAAHNPVAAGAAPPPQHGPRVVLTFATPEHAAEGRLLAKRSAIRGSRFSVAWHIPGELADTGGGSGGGSGSGGGGGGGGGGGTDGGGGDHGHYHTRHSGGGGGHHRHQYSNHAEYGSGHGSNGHGHGSHSAHNDFPDPSLGAAFYYDQHHQAHPVIGRSAPQVPGRTLLGAHTHTHTLHMITFFFFCYFD